VCPPLQELDAAAAELASSAPNMKAVEQYEAVREKEKQHVRGLEVFCAANTVHTSRSNCSPEPPCVFFGA
jgi:hypothetical protein